MYAIGSDHGGFALKQEIMKHLKSRGLKFKDYGTYTEDSCDYPVYGEAVARAVVSGECERGILVCGTGIGISIAANKVRGVRAAVCADCFSAEMAKCHNDANVICLGARVVGTGLALKIIDSFIDAEFESGRHGTRVEMLNSIKE